MGLLQLNQRAQLPEIDALLERNTRWLLTATWLPGGLSSKGGRPRQPPSALNVSNHLRLTTHLYERTRDPFFLVVSREMAVQGFARRTADVGSRATGLVFNYLPWLIAGLKRAGDPTLETEGKLQVLTGLVDDTLRMSPGEKKEVTVALTNRGTEPLTEARASFHARADFTVRLVSVLPTQVQPGERVELRYVMEAPAAAAINLSSEYNRNGYAHWTALYCRGGTAHFAHRWVRATVE